VNPFDFPVAVALCGDSARDSLQVSYGFPSNGWSEPDYKQDNKTQETPDEAEETPLEIQRHVAANSLIANPEAADIKVNSQIGRAHSGGHFASARGRTPLSRSPRVPIAV